MIDFGASRKEEKEFHKASAVVKIVWAVSWSVYLFPLNESYGSFHNSNVALVLLLLIQWTVFDIALNVFLKKENILYVGETAKTDKLLRKYLGEYAGLVKLLVVSSVILVINFFL